MARKSRRVALGANADRRIFSAAVRRVHLRLEQMERALVNEARMSSASAVREALLERRSANRMAKALRGAAAMRRSMDDLALAKRAEANARRHLAASERRGGLLTQRAAIATLATIPRSEAVRLTPRALACLS